MSQYPPQQPPNQHMQYPPQYEPPPQWPPPQPQKHRVADAFIIGLIVFIILLIAVNIIVFATNGVGNNSTSANSNATSQVTQPTQQVTQAAQPTQAPTQAPIAKPTKQATQALSHIPSASELSQLISLMDGKVTDVNTTSNSDRTNNVAVDVTVNSPTQSHVKHISFELAQFFFRRSDVNVVNFVFHANGYTGMDDPIAGSGGVAPSNWLGMDESQLWDAMAGVFNANLPAY